VFSSPKLLGSIKGFERRDLGVIIWKIYTVAKMLCDTVNGPRDVVVKIEIGSLSLLRRNLIFLLVYCRTCYVHISLNPNISNGIKYNGFQSFYYPLFCIQVSILWSFKYHYRNRSRENSCNTKTNDFTIGQTIVSNIVYLETIAILIYFLQL